MKILTKNIIKKQVSNLLGILCVLFFIFSLSARYNNTSIEKRETKTSLNKTNQKHTDNLAFQVVSTTIEDDFLYFFNSVESETTDEDSKEKSIQNDFASNILPSTYSLFKRLSLNYNLSFQRRIIIPFFLLHHSWKIPII